VWEAIALSFGLAMDATAVAAARGLAGQGRRELVILPLVFGGFQSGMSALGWASGEWLEHYLARWDRWIAFGLLVAIGLKMIIEAWRGDGDEPAPGTAMVYAGLGIATSIDAAAAGLTLHVLPVEPWVSITLIGVITAVCTAAGYLLGRALGHRLPAKLEAVAGCVLIGIGINLLIRGG
jgi:putative Mn2+ efflux pump MntP